jgi:drug/metabolite transporter (DMT)-like permease
MTKQDNTKLTGIRLYGIMLGMLLCGTLNTILMKLQDGTVALGKQYNHPFFQCAMMFVGELLCLGIYGLKLLYARH